MKPDPRLSRFRRIAPLLVAALLSPPPAGAASPPNLVLMMGDDHGWEETAYNGHPHLHTPVLDEMAATGLRLDRFYSAHPSCSPTRASFLTGRHPNRMGTFAPGWSFRPGEITLAHLAAEAGYRCGHFGKWHVGAVKRESPVGPLAMGYHECLAHDNFFELDPSLSRNGGPPEVHRGESSEILVAEAVRFLDRARGEGRPFLVTIWFGSPHEPYQGLPGDLARYDDLPARYPDKMVKLTSNETGLPTTRPLGQVLRERYAEITAMDRAIGTLRRHLAEAGLRENTLVFYCGDNGTSADGLLASPHRGRKGDIHEGGIRVPGLLEWPAAFPRPAVSRLPANTSDLLPTVAVLLGRPLSDRPLDGIDLMPLLRAGRIERPSPMFFWEYDTRGLAKASPGPYLDPGLQQGTTPLVKKSGGLATRNFLNFLPPPRTGTDLRGPRAVLFGNHKLVLGEDRDGAVRRELYDLSADPGEGKNLAAERPAVTAELEEQLLEWQHSVLRSLGGADYSP